MPGNAWHILKHSIYFIKFLIMNTKRSHTPTFTALYLMVMLMLTIFTSVAVAQTPEPTQITTIEQLNSVRNDLDGDYVLMNNLDFADGPITYRPQSTSDATVAGPAADATNAGFAPIGDNTNRFTGTFDGGGFTISNLYIRASTNNIGLFGYISGSNSRVQNLGLVNAYVKGAQYTGGLVGWNFGGTITNCYATGAASGTNTVGGLLGQSFNGTIRNCFATATVTGTTNTGGLVGWNFSSATITNCYATGTVTGGNDTGGLVGNNSNATIENCYATGTVTGTDNIGGLVGNNTGTIASSFYQADASDSETTPGARTESDIQALTAPTGWGTDSWDFGTDSQYPALRNSIGDLFCSQPTPRSSLSCPLVPNAEGKSEITSIEDLNRVRYNLDGDYELLNNLDFNDDNSYATGVVNNAYRPLDNTDPTASGAAVVPDPADGQNPGFTPIGSFTGTFEGNNFTISNLYINLGVNDVGLFSAISGSAMIQNLGLVNVYVKSSPAAAQSIGALVGYKPTGTITNCYATGTVTVSSPSGTLAGGLVGYNLAGTIENCYANINVSNTTSGGSKISGGLVGNNAGTINNSYAIGAVTGDSRIGGLVGRNNNSAEITNCYATENVTGTGDYIGGLVGENSGSTIENCYATGTALGSSVSDYVGGIVGRNNNSAEITNCYAAVTTSGDLYIGGLVGENHSSSTITNSYATGNVTGDLYIGGLVGENHSSSTITNSYATGAASGRFNIGGLVGTDTGTITNSFAKTTTQLQALTGDTQSGTPDATTIESGWGELNWDFGTNSQYPTLLSYKENDTPAQIQGEILCGQPAPRIICNADDPDGDGILRITTIEELNAIRFNPAGSYELVNDLDFTDPNSYTSGSVNSTYIPNASSTPEDSSTPGFQPIGDATNVFTGTFEGNGFTINNLYSKTNISEAGLFGAIGRGGAVQNLGILDVYIRRGSTESTKRNLLAGGLAGENAGSISNCYVTGTVRGFARNGDLRSAYVGGLVGLNIINGTINNCFATANCDAEATPLRDLLNNITGKNAKAIGGLVGFNVGTITNCYATGTATGRDFSISTLVGGLVGWNILGTITNSYATGTVSETAEDRVRTGGLVGYDYEGIISNSFWDQTTTNQTYSAGGGIGKTTAQLQALIGENVPVGVSPNATTINSGWGERNWDFGTNNQYPTLRSYEASEDSQAQGLVFCNQPATTHIQCNTTTPILQISPINFGAATEPITKQLVILGRNLDSDVTLTVASPFAFAEDALTATLSPVNEAINTNIAITFTPGTAQAYESTLTTTGGGAPDLTVRITGIAVPALEDGDGDGLLEIEYIEQLNFVRNDLGGQYELKNNLDFASPSSYATGEINNNYRPNATNIALANNTGFTPIGDLNNPFTGTFDGDSFTISNLYSNINGTNTTYIGLFGAVGTRGIVQNIGLLNAYVTGTGIGTSNVIIGGIVGYNNNGNIRNSYATGTALGIASEIGNSNVIIGGLVGENSGNIRNSYANVEITAIGTGSVITGGLIGRNINGNIRNTYATGAVGTDNSNGITGGLIGWNDNGNINNSYATGAVGTDEEEIAINEGNEGNQGGLLGYNNGGSINNCFWDAENTNQPISPGSPKDAGLTTEKMLMLTAGAFESTSNPDGSGWNAFDWDFGTTSQYPALRTYEESAGSQTQGTLFCPQPQPRTNAGCPSISITTDPPLVNNSYDFGTVATGDNATLTYTITGENLNAKQLTINIQGGAGDDNTFSTNTTSIPPVSGNIPATQVIITFTPTATANYTATITHSVAQG